jgi:hypothetical protein
MVDEIACLQPDVIILQSKACLKKEFDACMKRHPRVSNFTTFVEDACVATWKDPDEKQTIVASTHHPSYSIYCGGFEAYMEKHVNPQVNVIRGWFETRN